MKKQKKKKILRIKKLGCNYFVDDLENILSNLPKNIVKILKIRRLLVEHYIADPPDVFIGIDLPDFNLSLEKRLKKLGILTVHYVSPTVWAWRTWRIKKIKEAVDHMLVLFPFERNFYAKHGVDAASKSVSAAQAALEKGNWSPAAGIQALMSLAATTASLYNVVEKSDEVVAKAGLAKEWSQIAQGAKAIGQKIAGDAKEQQKEWVELRKFVNATIIAEARRKK